MCKFSNPYFRDSNSMVTIIIIIIIIINNYSGRGTSIHRRVGMLVISFRGHFEIKQINSIVWGILGIKFHTVMLTVVWLEYLLGVILNIFDKHPTHFHLCFPPGISLFDWQHLLEKWLMCCHNSMCVYHKIFCDLFQDSFNKKYY